MLKIGNNEIVRICKIATQHCLQATMLCHGANRSVFSNCKMGKELFDFSCSLFHGKMHPVENIPLYNTYTKENG